MQNARRPPSLARASAGRSKPARTAMMAITTSSSISVKAAGVSFVMRLWFMVGFSWPGELFVASLFPQFFEQRFQRQRVDDVRLREPAFARDARAEAQETGVLIAMRVAIDHTLYAFALRVRPEPPVQVETKRVRVQFNPRPGFSAGVDDGLLVDLVRDRKSTRLNSSHLVISYAVFCLKKKN